MKRENIQKKHEEDLRRIRNFRLLDDLDQFIRDIWVECCGHLSAFYIEGKMSSF